MGKSSENLSKSPQKSQTFTIYKTQCVRSLKKSSKFDFEQIQEIKSHSHKHKIELKLLCT